MLRKLVCTVLTFAFCTVCLVAADISGKAKSYKKGDKDAASTLTVTVKDKDQEITLAKGAKLIDATGAEVKGKDRGKALKEIAGKDVTVKTESKDGKDVGTEIKLK